MGVKKLIYNQLKEVLTHRYSVETFIPSAELLQNLGMTKVRFNKIYNKKADPTFDEVRLIQEYLNITFVQLHSGFKALKSLKSIKSKSDKNVQVLNHYQKFQEKFKSKIQ
jgi:transcriptional regulator with XRE-family HTH domain